MRVRHPTTIIVMLTSVLALLGPAAGAEPTPGFRYAATLFGQMNPRALALDLRMHYRHAFGADDGRPAAAFGM